MFLISLKECVFQHVFAESFDFLKRYHAFWTTEQGFL